MYCFRFIASYFIEPRFFVGFSQALDRYCEEDHLNCLKFAGALDYILKGEFFNLKKNDALIKMLILTF